MEYILGGFSDNPNLIIEEAINYFNNRFNEDFKYSGIVEGNFFLGILNLKNTELFNFHMKKHDNGELEISKSLYHRESVINLINEINQDENLDKAINSVANSFIYSKYTKNNNITTYVDKFAREKLYYSIKSPILFSSSFKCLIHLQKQKKFNINELFRVLGTGDSYGYETVYKNIFRLHTGEKLQINKNGNVKITKIWKFTRDMIDIPYLNGIKLEDWPDYVYDIFKEILTPPNKEPYLVLMSGGLDSTIIASIIKKEFDVPVEAITMSVPGYNEEDVYKAKVVARYLGINHYIKEVEQQKNSSKYYNEVFNIMEEPIAGTAYFSRYELYKGVKELNKNNTISGDGVGFALNYLMEIIIQRENIVKMIQKTPLELRKFIRLLLSKFHIPITNLSYKLNSKLISRMSEAILNSSFLEANTLFEAFFAPFQYTNPKIIERMLGKKISLKTYFEPTFKNFSEYPIQDANRYGYALLSNLLCHDVLHNQFATYFDIRNFGMFFSDISFTKLLPIPKEAKLAYNEKKWMMKEMAKKYNLLPRNYFKYKNKYGLLQEYQKRDKFEETQKYVKNLIDANKDNNILPLKHFKYYFDNVDFKRMRQTQEYMRYNSWLGFLGWFNSC